MDITSESLKQLQIQTLVQDHVHFLKTIFYFETYRRYLTSSTESDICTESVIALIELCCTEKYQKHMTLCIVQLCYPMRILIIQTTTVKHHGGRSSFFAPSSSPTWRLPVFLIACKNDDNHVPSYELVNACEPCIRNIDTISPIGKPF